MVNPDVTFGRLGNRLFQCAYIYSQVKKGLIPDVYIQDPAYFEDYEEEIKELFGENIAFLPYVSIHLRRGDYVDNPFYVDLCKTNYYDQAISLFPKSKFLVFSDDPEFARSYFTDETRFQIMEGGDEIEDLNTMASCSQGNIVANSSFSWWAAFLNPSPVKKIVAPSPQSWHPDGVERTRYPQDWILLDTKPL